MTREELLLRRLSGQHLLIQAQPRAVARDLCGLQAQFLSNSLHALAIRSDSVATEALGKSWTLRGTMHLFALEDLPLFLYRDRRPALRPVDTMGSDAYIHARRKAYFAQLILEAVAQGQEDRQTLRDLCESHAMTEAEGKSLFDPWGGLIRALCEEGKLLHKVQQKKAYRLCPAFTPLEREQAWPVLLTRYFTHYGPATVKDAAYFFGITQGAVNRWLEQLPVLCTQFEGRRYYYVDRPIESREIPECLFLAGFDPLMLGYEKKQSLFLPQMYMREVFNLAGIVRPTILMNGSVVGRWSRKNSKLTVDMFCRQDQERIRVCAKEIWPELKTIDFS